MELAFITQSCRKQRNCKAKQGETDCKINNSFHVDTLLLHLAYYYPLLGHM